MAKDEKNIEKEIKDKAKEVLNAVKDDSKSFTKKEIEDGKIMSILCYIPIFVLIPYFSEDNNKYMKYHAKQGVNLFIWEIIFAVATSFFDFSFLSDILDFVIGLAILALIAIGIINVTNGKAKELPVINKLKFVK